MQRKHFALQQYPLTSPILTLGSSGSTASLVLGPKVGDGNAGLSHVPGHQQRLALAPERPALALISVCRRVRRCWGLPPTPWGPLRATTAIPSETLPAGGRLSETAGGVSLVKCVVVQRPTGNSRTLSVLFSERGHRPLLQWVR